MNTSQYFCAVWVPEHWHKLPREVVVCPWRSATLEMVVGTVLWISLLEQGLGQVNRGPLTLGATTKQEDRTGCGDWHP